MHDHHPPTPPRAFDSKGDLPYKIYWFYCQKFWKVPLKGTREPIFVAIAYTQEIPDFPVNILLWFNIL